MQAEVREFEHEAAVHQAVGALQVAVDLEVALVQVTHALVEAEGSQWQQLIAATYRKFICCVKPFASASNLLKILIAF
jgi:hypothetical protein